MPQLFLFHGSDVCSTTLLVLQAGKVQFGDILGFSVMVLCGVYWIINCMAGEEEGGIELGRVSSLYGYCLIPLVLHAAVVVIFPAR